MSEQKWLECDCCGEDAAPFPVGDGDALKCGCAGAVTVDEGANGEPVAFTHVDVPCDRCALRGSFSGGREIPVWDGKGEKPEGEHYRDYPWGREHVFPIEPSPNTGGSELPPWMEIREITGAQGAHMLMLDGQPGSVSFDCRGDAELFAWAAVGGS